MSSRVTGGRHVVPFEALVYVRCATDVMPRRIDVAAENVNESGPNSTHPNSCSHGSSRRESVIVNGKSSRVNRRTHFLSTRGLLSGAETEVRLRSLRELRRDSLRVSECSLTVRRRAKGEPTWPKLAPRSVASEGWLGGRDSNPDNGVQSAVSYRCTTSQ